jgi:tryptophan synthase alpha chain
MISIYWPLGYPTMARSIELCLEAIDAGADWLELGIPYSDPVADGPVVEAASARALAQGTTVADCFAAAKQIHAARPDTKLVAMTYANIVYQIGWENWAIKLAESGISGCILPDVTLEESGPIRAALLKQGIAWHPLVTPITPDARMRDIVATATGFVYVVSSTGITGMSGPGDVAQLVSRVQAESSQLVAVGFGIRSKEDVATIAALGAHAIVGSEAIRNEPRLGEYVRSLL